MFSVKKILKRTLGGLKMAAAWAPIVLFGGGILTFIGAGIGYLATLPNPEKYTESPIYKQEVINDVARYQESYESGFMSQDDYLDAINNIGSDEYIEEVVSRDIEGNEEWRAYLKSANSPLGISSLSCLGLGIAAGILTVVWYVNDVKDDLEWSASEDFEWEPPKKEPKPPKQEPVQEEVSAIKDDLTSDEEELGSTDDFINSFQ